MRVAVRVAVRFVAILQTEARAGSMGMIVPDSQQELDGRQPHWGQRSAYIGRLVPGVV